MREQWWDEERFDGDFFSVRSPGTADPRNWSHREAFNWFHRQDGKIVGLWKWSEAALSSDEGKTWSRPVKCPTLQMTGAKISGRKTTDGRYALVYNPNLDDDHRWPLAIVTGDDGILFDHMPVSPGRGAAAPIRRQVQRLRLAIQPLRRGRKRPHAGSRSVGHLQH